MIFFPRIHSSFRPGLSLLEAVIAIGLLATFASALFVAIVSQELVSVGTKQSLEAVSLASEGLEAVRAIRDTGWASVTTGTHGLQYVGATWSFQNTSDTNSGYTRSVTVTALSATERQIVSTVSWRSPTNRIRTISLATTLSNWLSDSIPRLSGDWRNPQTLGTIDLGPGNQATGIKVNNGMVYLSASAASASKPDFYVIDAQHPATPSIVGSVNTGPGVNGLATMGTFAYLANEDSTNQLQIVNFVTPATPQHIKNYHLAGNTEEAKSIAATGTLAIVGTGSDSGPELFLVNVSDPTAPLTLSTVEVGASVNRIFLLGNMAYLATSSSTHEFMIVDISNPNVPVIRSSVNLAGSNGPAMGLYVNYQDNRAYITRQQDSGTSPEINIYNVSNPDSPTFLGSLEFGGDIPAVFAADTLMFLGSALSNLEFQIYDATNPASMSYYSGLNFPQVANDIAFENNVLYVAVRSNDALRIITSQ